jgi:hypothetical protein
LSTLSETCGFTENLLNSGTWKQSVVIERSRFVQTVEQRRLQHHTLAANVALRTMPALR